MRQVDIAGDVIIFVVDVGGAAAQPLAIKEQRVDAQKEKDALADASLVHLSHAWDQVTEQSGLRTIFRGLCVEKYGDQLWQRA